MELGKREKGVKVKELGLGLGVILFSIVNYVNAVKANTVLRVECSDYGLETIYKKDTETYEFSFCWNKEESIHAFYYLGGMRKKNEDHFILLKVNSWGQDYFVVENEGYRYVLNPSCGPNNIKVFYCETFKPESFSIYEGSKLLDSEEILNTYN